MVYLKSLSRRRRALSFRTLRQRTGRLRKNERRNATIKRVEQTVSGHLAGGCAQASSKGSRALTLRPFTPSGRWLRGKALEILYQSPRSIFAKFFVKNHTIPLGNIPTGNGHIRRGARPMMNSLAPSSRQIQTAPYFHNSSLYSLMFLSFISPSFLTDTAYFR